MSLQRMADFERHSLSNSKF